MNLKDAFISVDQMASAKDRCSIYFFFFQKSLIENVSFMILSLQGGFLLSHRAKTDKLKAGA